MSHWFWQAITTQRATIHSKTTFHNKLPSHRSANPFSLQQSLSKQIKRRRCKSSKQFIHKNMFPCFQRQTVFKQVLSGKQGCHIFNIIILGGSWFTTLINAVLASNLEKLADKNMIAYKKTLLIYVTNNENFSEKNRIDVACANLLSCGTNKSRKTYMKTGQVCK